MGAIRAAGGLGRGLDHFEVRKEYDLVLYNVSCFFLKVVCFSLVVSAFEGDACRSSLDVGLLRFIGCLSCIMLLASKEKLLMLSYKKCRKRLRTVYISCDSRFCFPGDYVM